MQSFDVDFALHQPSGSTYRSRMKRGGDDRLSVFSALQYRIYDHQQDESGCTCDGSVHAGF